MKKYRSALALFLLFLSAASTHAADPVYVGGGRYYCGDNSARCAEIDRRNDQIESQTRERDEERDYYRARERERDHDRDRESTRERYR